MHVKRVVVVAVGALGVGAAVAGAAIPGRDGTINACYQSRDRLSPDHRLLSARGRGR
jgi:hypothetical protein